jgi:1-acyl-sn-glycerol-3-phosphate acyltransferase
MIVLSFLRSFFGGIFFLALTVLLSIITMSLIVLRLPRAWADRVICFWGETTMKLFGIRLSEKGRENIPEGACLFLFNHTSFFDIFAMSARLPGMRFGAKIELFKIPFFGRAMRMAGVLPIARHNREKVFRVYERAQARTERGQQFSLSPEGSRNTEETLLPFKAGPFIFAINSGIPIVPVVIKGAAAVYPKYAILPNWRRWRAEIEMEYLPLVQVDEFTMETRSELQKRVYMMMKPYFQQAEPSESLVSGFSSANPTQ